MEFPMARQCSVNRRSGLVGRTVSAQAAQPHGPIGWALGHLWVHEAAAVDDSAVALLDPAPGEQVLELGCGPAGRPPRSPGAEPMSPAWIVRGMLPAQTQRFWPNA